MRLRLKLFLAAEYTLFAIVFVYLYQTSGHAVNWNDFVFFALALFVFSNLTTLMNAGTKITTSNDLPILLSAIVILNPLYAGLIAMLGTIKIRKIRNNLIWYKFLFNRTMFFLMAAIPSLIFQTKILAYNTILSLLIITLIFTLINTILICLVIKLEGKLKNFSSTLYFIETFKTVPVVCLLSILVYSIYINWGKSFFLLGSILIYIIDNLFVTHMQQINHYTEIIEPFLKMISSKDNYTNEHCERVAKYTKTLCKELGLGLSKTNRITQMARIHDVGKLNVPDDVLKSTTPLTDKQNSEMIKHSFYGYEVLQDIGIKPSDAKIILHHHEHYDGNGYPEGISGDDIPLGAQVLAICDAFDVMANGTVCEVPMKKEEVITELKKQAGKQFDPQISYTMIKLLENGKFDDVFANNLANYKQRYNVATTVN